MKEFKDMRNALRGLESMAFQKEYSDHSEYIMTTSGIMGLIFEKLVEALYPCRYLSKFELEKMQWYLLKKGYGIPIPVMDKWSGKQKEEAHQFFISEDATPPSFIIPYYIKEK